MLHIIPYRTVLYRTGTVQFWVSQVSSLLAPFVLLSDLRLLFWRKVVADVKGGSDFLRRLSLDHAGDGRTGQIQQGLDVHVIGRQDEFKENDLFDIAKVGIPLLDHVGHVLALQGLFDFRHGIFLVVLTKFNHLLKDRGLDVGQGDFVGVFVSVLCGECEVCVCGEREGRKTGTWLSSVICQTYHPSWT
jgi:hypothetical protein